MQSWMLFQWNITWIYNRGLIFLILQYYAFSPPFICLMTNDSEAILLLSHNPIYPTSFCIWVIWMCLRSFLCWKPLVFTMLYWETVEHRGRARECQVNKAVMLVLGQVNIMNAGRYKSRPLFTCGGFFLHLHNALPLLFSVMMQNKSLATLSHLILELQP